MRLSLRARVLFTLIATAAVTVAVAVVGFGITDGEFRTVRDDTTRTVNLQTLSSKLGEAISDEYAAARQYLLSVETDPRTASGARTTWADMVTQEQAILGGDAKGTNEGTFVHWLWASPARANASDCATALSGFEHICETLFAPDGIRDSNLALRGTGSARDTAWESAVLARTTAPTAANAVDLLRTGDVAFAALQAKLERLRELIEQGPQHETGRRMDQVSNTQFGFLLLVLAAALAMLLISSSILDRWVTRPLRRMVSVARRVEAGGEASFGLDRDDELGQLGGALEAMRVRMTQQQAEMEADARQASTINRFTDAAAFVEDEDGLAAAVLDALVELGGAEDAVVHVATVTHDKAVMEAKVGSVSIDDISVGQMDACPGVRRGGLYTTPDLEHALAVRCPVYPATAGALACVPLGAGGETLGVAHLHWPEPRTLPLPIRAAIGRVTEHAGMTISNLRLLTALRVQSPIDSQTALPNARAFDEALERAMVGRREGHDVAVLLIDVDSFSAFNDRNGTPAGDDALRFFARTLNSCLRETDVAGRYGPEEFAVMLPEMSIEQATEVADRIRLKTETTVLPVGRDGNERMTVSVGVAVAPHDGATRVAILRAADKALHEAKLSGRNRVVAATHLLIEDETAPASPQVQGHMVVITRAAPS